MKRPSSFLLSKAMCLMLCLLSGCAGISHYPDGTVKPISGWLESPVVERVEVSVPEFQDDPPPVDYVVGPTDVLSISYQGYAGSGLQSDQGTPSTQASGSGGEKASGSRVDGSGNIYLPMAGKVKVNGLTTEQIQEKLEAALKPYITHPSVIVEVTRPRSQPLYLIGQFKTPGVYYMDRPINLIQGMALANGPDSSANLRSARLLRNKKLIAVDIYGALIKGDLRHNVWLKGGDTIYLPDSKNQNVYVFGAVKIQGAIPMVNGQLSLAQALSQSGFGEVSFDSRIRIIRSLSTTHGELYVIDFNRIINGEALPFMLAEGDIVFVPRSILGNWNLALNEFLPTLQAIGAVLNPFVQLKYLLDANK